MKVVVKAEEPSPMGDVPVLLLSRGSSQMPAFCWTPQGSSGSGKSDGNPEASVGLWSARVSLLEEEHPRSLRAVPRAGLSLWAVPVPTLCSVPCWVRLAAPGAAGTRCPSSPGRCLSLNHPQDPILSQGRFHPAPTNLCTFEDLHSKAHCAEAVVEWKLCSAVKAGCCGKGSSVGPAPGWGCARCWEISHR